MNREETIEYLKKENIDFTIIEHDYAEGRQGA